MAHLKPNRFQACEFTEEEERLAKHVSHLFMMYLQNKIADCANAVVEYEYAQDENARQNPFKSILEHEVLKAQVRVLEDLMNEIEVPSEVQPN